MVNKVDFKNKTIYINDVPIKAITDFSMNENFENGNAEVSEITVKFLAKVKGWNTGKVRNDYQFVPMKESLFRKIIRFLRRLKK